MKNLEMFLKKIEKRTLKVSLIFLLTAVVVNIPVNLSGSIPAMIIPWSFLILFIYNLIKYNKIKKALKNDNFKIYNLNSLDYILKNKINFLNKVFLTVPCKIKIFDSGNDIEDIKNYKKIFLHVDAIDFDFLSTIVNNDKELQVISIADRYYIFYNIHKFE